METLDRPPPRPLKTLAMEDCIACHTKSKANTVRESNAARSVNVSVQRLANDCVGCHR
jgi:nitrate/TMAO reductase-like tetraheme cytochrome c subunit